MCQPPRLNPGKGSYGCHLWANAEFALGNRFTKPFNRSGPPSDFTCPPPACESLSGDRSISTRERHSGARELSCLAELDLILVHGASGSEFLKLATCCPVIRYEILKPPFFKKNNNNMDPCSMSLWGSVSRDEVLVDTCRHSNFSLDFCISLSTA